MRAATVLLGPGDGPRFHPVDDAAAAGVLERERLRYVNPTDDGRLTTLHEVRGDPQAVRSTLEDAESVETVRVSDAPGLRSVFTVVDPRPVATGLLAQPVAHGFAIEPPIECVGVERLRVTVVGTQAHLTGAVEDFPGSVAVELESLGSYGSGPASLADQLTDRQHEILRAAVEAGYYDVPRGVTYEDVAERVDVAPGTVGEHLRKIESRVLGELV